MFCSFLCDLIAPWNFGSVCDTRDSGLEFSSSGCWRSCFTSRRRLHAATAEEAEEGTRLQPGMRTELTWLGLMNQGADGGSVCISGLEFLCETKGGEVYFVQNWILCGTLSDVTYLVSLFGQPNSALFDMEPRIGDEISVFCTSRCNTLMHFREFRA